MGWVWKDDVDDDSVHITSAGDVAEFGGSSNPNGDGGRCATRKVVQSQCRTEEVEPGKFIRKCEKTEQLFKDCVGSTWDMIVILGIWRCPKRYYKPSEMVQSNKEYTEEDVTDQMVKGSFPKSTEGEPFYFPGLRGDIEAIERNFLGGIDRFFQAAEDMKKEFFKSVERVPHTYDGDAPSSSRNKRRIPIEGHPLKEGSTGKNSDGDCDFSGLATDV
ncbi:hypothetical protein CASFOL_027176 [Castilleja foliolosa]|uniref:Uncharacterized protein n=1 Tax=Castilleja foliolosa TaxID=1961234 RepID=A0ABD3CE17_9LAMI